MKGVEIALNYLKSISAVLLMFMALGIVSAARYGVVVLRNVVAIIIFSFMELLVLIAMTFFIWVLWWNSKSKKNSLDGGIL